LTPDAQTITIIPVTIFGVYSPELYKIYIKLQPLQLSFPTILSSSPYSLYRALPHSSLGFCLIISLSAERPAASQEELSLMDLALSLSLSSVPGL
jgi:hypothetical protein